MAHNTPHSFSVKVLLGGSIVCLCLLIGRIALLDKTSTTINCIHCGHEFNVTTATETTCPHCHNET